MTGTAGTVRALGAAERDAFRLARLRAADMAPYFMHALFAAHPLAAPGLGTFGVDKHWRLYMDPAALTGPGAWSPGQAGAVLVHEVEHLLREHAGRATLLPQPLHKLAWGYAIDAEINDSLIAAGIPLPGDPVTPAGLGLPNGGVAEDYYAALLDRASSLSDYDDGGPGCGSGAGGPALPGELPAGATVDGAAGAGLSGAEADLIRRIVAAEVLAHAKSRGTVPAGLERWAGGVLAPPVVPWSVVLRAAVRRAIADQVGRTDYTYSRPSRRRIPGLGVIRPAMRGPSVIVAVVVDTSGSMSQDDLDAALSEIAGVLAASGVARDRVTVLCCDAKASAPRKVRTVEDVRLVGGGGTDMRVGIAGAAAARPAPHVIVVLTDGYTPWPGEPTRARLVCAVIAPDEPAGTPEWATTVHVPTVA
jgi:predicted metal-dependent peptidase